MKTRGRTSASAQAMATLAEDPLARIQRPDAPYDLTDEQATEWWAVVNRMPADWFPHETHALLAQYCRLVVRAGRTAELANEMETSKDFDLSVYRALLRTERELSQAICSLATKMRISQQATMFRTKKRDLRLRRPWEV
jgi:hypothetical protein